MDSTTLITVAVVVLAYGLVSKRLESGLLTPPMAFVLAGLLVGSRALGVLDFDKGTEAIHLFAELTLILILFTDAARIDLRALRRDYGLPLRLLAIGMPATLVAGTLIGKWIFPELGWFEAALLAAVLAPTDAALGQAVVSNEAVPPPIRRTLNVESGLNDGIALPVVLILASCAESMGQGELTPWVGFTLKQVVLGPVVGALVGWIGGKAVDLGGARDWMSGGFQRLAGVALAFLSYGLAEWVGGNGFIAAFVGGLVMGNAVRSSCAGLYEFAETEGELLELITFLLFGAVLIGPAAELWDGAVWLYAVLSLTVVRMVPVAMSLIGSRCLPITTAFLGWFGPRGLASILFGLLIVERMEIAAHERVASIAIATILLSVFAHGLTAAPAASWYGRRVKRLESARETTHHPEF